MNEKVHKQNVFALLQSELALKKFDHDPNKNASYTYHEKLFFLIEPTSSFLFTDFVILHKWHFGKWPQCILFVNVVNSWEETPCVSEY